MQQFAKGLRPIAFLSQQIKVAERNYPIGEQLGRRQFMDHQSLQSVEVSAMATPRQVRWPTHLSEFDFSSNDTPSNTNVVADGLSRAAAGEVSELEEPGAPYELLISALAEMEPIPVNMRQAAVRDAKYQ